MCSISSRACEESCSDLIPSAFEPAVVLMAGVQCVPSVYRAEPQISSDWFRTCMYCRVEWVM